MDKDKVLKFIGYALIVLIVLFLIWSFIMIYMIYKVSSGLHLSFFTVDTAYLSNNQTGTSTGNIMKEGVSIPAVSEEMILNHDIFLGKHSDVSRWKYDWIISHPGTWFVVKAKVRKGDTDDMQTIRVTAIQSTRSPYNLINFIGYGKAMVEKPSKDVYYYIALIDQDTLSRIYDEIKEEQKRHDQMSSCMAINRLLEEDPREIRKICSQ